MVRAGGRARSGWLNLRETLCSYQVHRPNRDLLPVPGANCGAASRSRDAPLLRTSLGPAVASSVNGQFWQAAAFSADGVVRMPVLRSEPNDDARRAFQSQPVPMDWTKPFAVLCIRQCHGRTECVLSPY